MTLLLALAAQVAAPASPAPPVAMPPQDWSTLRPLPFLKDPADGATLSSFVRAEVRAGRCAAAVQGASGWSLRVDVAVLVGAGGQPRRVVPRAIQCPAVEQYAAGLVSSMARGNVVPPPEGEGWYRTSLTFAWAQ